MLICKWGFDGSGGHGTYKQKFIDTERTDDYIFISAFVPIKLFDIETGKQLWTNELTSVLQTH